MALGMAGMAMSTELEGVDALDREAIEAVSTLHSQTPVGT
jgi:hypothetical protein